MWSIWPNPRSSLGGHNPPAHPLCPSCASLRDRRGSGMKAAVNPGRHKPSTLSAWGCSAAPLPSGVPGEYKSTRTPSLHFSVLWTDALHKDSSYYWSCTTNETHHSMAVKVPFENQNGCSCFSSSLHPIKNIDHLSHWGANNHFC